MYSFDFKWLEDDTYAVMSYDGNEKDVIIPSEYNDKPVTMLNDELFSGHKELEKITLPDTLKIIGSFAFRGCENLKSVRLPAGLTDMLQYAFSESGIEIIDIPGSVRSITPYAFSSCKNLGMVICHEGIKKIYAYAFKDCKNLTVAAVHKDTEVNHDAFAGCEHITPEVKLSLKGRCSCAKCNPGKPKINVMQYVSKKQK